jgi:hypothetical protein
VTRETIETEYMTEQIFMDGPPEKWEREVRATNSCGCTAMERPAF